MRDNGFIVSTIDADNINEVKKRNNVPLALSSCHTAIVDGYVVEGHVPAAEVKKMLEERPKFAGIAVAGMPIGAPGMEVEGSAPQPYSVIAFDKAGKTEIYASYTP
jgi:hypothetical protein